MRALIVAGLLLGITTSASAQPHRFVVAIGGIMHESNSFNPTKTVVSDFEGMRGTTNLTGADLLASLRKSNTEITGYLEAADAEKFDVFPAYIASATPKGPLTKDTFETLTRDCFPA
jgi:microcystin degradation protein MlrC